LELFLFFYGAPAAPYLRQSLWGCSRVGGGGFSSHSPLKVERLHFALSYQNFVAEMRPVSLNVRPKKLTFESIGKIVSPVSCCRIKGRVWTGTITAAGLLREPDSPIRGGVKLSGDGEAETVQGWTGLRALGPQSHKSKMN